MLLSKSKLVSPLLTLTAVPLPRGVLADPRGRLVYFLNVNRVFAYTTDTFQRFATYNTAGQVNVGFIASADGNFIYTAAVGRTSGQPGVINIINTRSGAIQSVDLPSNTVGLNLAISPDGQTLYFPNGNRIVVFKTATRTFATSLRLSGIAGSVSVSNDGTKLYTTILQNGDLIASFYVVDLANNNTVRTVPTNASLGRVLAIAMTPDSSRLLVTSSVNADTPGKLAVLDPATYNPIGSPYQLGLLPKQAKFVNVPHSLTFYLHGNNSTGLVDPSNPGGANATFVMDTQRNGTASGPQLLGEQSYYTYELLTGSFTAGSSFQVVPAGGLSLGVGADFTLFTTAADGTAATEVASGGGLLNTGPVVLNVTNPIPPLSAQRLLLKVSGIAGLDLGGSFTLRTPSFTGAP